MSEDAHFYKLSPTDLEAWRAGTLSAVTMAPSVGAVKKEAASVKPDEQLWSWAINMVSGLKELPLCVWSDQVVRSKLPPGAHEGSSAGAGAAKILWENESSKACKMVEVIRPEGLVEVKAVMVVCKSFR